MIGLIVKHIKARQDKLITLADQILVSGSNFIIGILLARILGIETYGKYALAWMIVLFCSGVFQAWIITPMYNFLPASKEAARNKYLQGLNMHVFLVIFIAFLLSWLFLSTATIFFPQWKIEQTAIWLPLTIAAYLIYEYTRRLAYASGNIKTGIVLNAIVFSTQILSFAILSKELNLIFTFKIMCFSYAISSILWYYNNQVYTWSIDSFREVFWMHWTFSKWLVGTALLQWFSGNLFVLAAGSILGPIAVGGIRILQNIIGVLHVFFLAIDNYIPIRSSKIYLESGIKGLTLFYKNIMLKGILLTALIGSSLAFFGSNIINVLYNQAHQDLAILLYAFAVLYVLVYIGTILRFAFRTINFTQPIFTGNVIATVFSLLLAHPIIHLFGINGVLFGLIVTQILTLTWFIYSLQIKTKKLWISYI